MLDFQSPQLPVAMQRASQIIGNISAASKPRKKADPPVDPIIDMEQVACAAWARSVGKKIAQHTRPSKLVRGRLVVEVEDAVWQRNLFTLTKHITSNLEKSLGPGIITEIEFRIMPPRREPQRAAVSLASDEADLIADPGMRRLYRVARHKETA